ncbi:hypothetical protein BJ741DRAFT_609714, partial [Chytriomyces cf. hyalinus JEL632]
MRNVSSYDMAALCTHGILTLSSVLELAYLGYFSAMIERRVNAERPTIFSRFNMTIFSLSLSLISFHAATAVNVYERPYLFEFPIARTVTGLSLCIYELMYVWYTWLRSKVILKLKGGFRYNVAVAVVAIAPGISAVQFVALCFHLYSSDELKPAAMVASNVTTAVSGMAIIAFDCIMLCKCQHWSDQALLHYCHIWKVVLRRAAWRTAYLHFDVSCRVSKRICKPTVSILPCYDSRLIFIAAFDEGGLECM